MYMMHDVLCLFENYKGIISTSACERTNSCMYLKLRPQNAAAGTTAGYCCSTITNVFDLINIKQKGLFQNSLYLVVHVNHTQAAVPPNVHHVQ